MKTKVRSLIPDTEPTFHLDIVGPKTKIMLPCSSESKESWIWLSTGMSLRGPKSLLVKFIFLPGHVPPPLRCPFPSDLKQRRTVHSITIFAYYIHLCWWNIETGLRSAVSTQQSFPHTQAAEDAMGWTQGSEKAGLKARSWAEAGWRGHGVCSKPWEDCEVCVI